MKIRIISDLHIDINSKYSFTLKDDIFTLIAGDISGNINKTILWLKDNVKKGVFISGNHDVYDTKMPLEDIKEKFKSHFPIDSDITYLDNDIGVISKEIAPGILLVADVLYTDYKYKCLDLSIYGGNNINDIENTNMLYADPVANYHISGLNDFIYGLCKKSYDWKPEYIPGHNMSYRLTPKWYKKHFEAAFENITKIIEGNKNKQIILMTHHCLTPLCISDEFKTSPLNASFISDKTKWILDHENIKCVISGHVHNRKIFKVGNALYIVNPLGYYYEAYGYNKNIKDSQEQYLNCILDTDSWTVSS